jgi:CHAD domain-containing protein
LRASGRERSGEIAAVRCADRERERDRSATAKRPLHGGETVTDPGIGAPVERGVKLAAGPSFRMPSLDRIVDGTTVVPKESERLSTTYLDTEDLRLARWGVSLRHRAGEGWTVKLPPESDATLLVRSELTFAENGRRPPGAAVDLLRAFIRNEDLRPQTRLETLRRRVELHDPVGRLLAEVVDDEVSVFEGRRIAARFRELEVEIGTELPPASLDVLLERLRWAGAGPADPTARYVRALGPRAARPPEVFVPNLVSGATAGDVLRRAIAASVVRLILHDPVMRLDADPEGVHQARVATRRLRSDLRTFAPLLEPTWAGPLREELGWLGGILGAVRDGDVLLERMRKSAATLERNARGAVRVLSSLEAARDEAHAELLAVLRGERYVTLLDRLVAAANEPALLLEADLPAPALLTDLVRRPWRSLAKTVKSLGPDPTDEQLHDVRIRTKRVRYAAEAVTPLVGKQARAFSSAAARLQEVLGDLNDAVVAEAWLVEWARGSRSMPGVFSAGELAGLERANAKECRGRWAKAWRELASPKLRSWM